MVLGSLQCAACSGEAAPAEEREHGGSAPEPAATAESSRTEERSPEKKSGLAAKMRALIAETDDAAAANIALMTFYSDGLSDYQIDEAGVIALGREYLQAGDDALAEVVFSFLQMEAYQVTGGVTADLWAAQGDVSLARGNVSGAKDMYEVALNTDPNHAYSKQRLAALEGGQTPKPSPAAPSRAENRDAPNRLSIGRRGDLARFRFRYTEAGGSNRTLMVSETCYNSGVLRALSGKMRRRGCSRASRTPSSSKSMRQPGRSPCGSNSSSTPVIRASRPCS